MARIADTLGLASFGVVGISGGGPYALAVAALLPDRVTRCATIVSGAPYDAEGLDFFDGMDDATRADWQATVADGENYLLAANRASFRPRSIGCSWRRSGMDSRRARAATSTTVLA